MKFFKGLLLLLIISLFTSVAGYSTIAVSSADEVTVDYYGRTALSTLDNSDALVYAYDQIVDCIENRREEALVTTGSYTLSVEELKTVYDAYRRDHPEHFWLGNSYNYAIMGDSVVKIVPTYLSFTLEQIEAFDDKVEELLLSVDLTASDFEIELALHDRLASTVVYKETANAHNAYGAIVEGEAVCEGYAEALQYLLQRAGIQSFIALGTSINANTGLSENHAWNYVKIDGNYYHVDLTWDDQESYTYHAYFNVSDEQITKDHTLSATAYALPICNSQTANYFNVYGGKVAEPTVQAVANTLKQNNLRASFYVEDSVEGFLGWFNEKVAEIAQNIGISGEFSYGYMAIGQEVVLIINACLHTERTLIEAQTATCLNNGNIEYYICECGRWFATEDGDDEIYIRDSVITTAGHKYTVKIQDEEHLAKKAENCTAKDEYYFECEVCEKISDDDVFYSDNVGPHQSEDAFTYSDDEHWHKCKHCGVVVDETISVHHLQVKYHEREGDNYYKVEICTECKKEKRTIDEGFEGVTQLDGAGVRVTIPDDSNLAIEAGTALNTTEVALSDGRVTEGVKALTGKPEALYAVELSLFKDGEPVLTDGAISLTITVDTKGAKDVYVLTKLSDGSYKKHSATVNADGTVTFKADGKDVFTQGDGFVIVASAGSLFNDLPIEKLAIIGIALLAIIIFVSVIFSKRGKNKKSKNK